VQWRVKAEAALVDRPHQGKQDRHLDRAGRVKNAIGVQLETQISFEIAERDGAKDGAVLPRDLLDGSAKLLA
jgi:hypothetical protein